LVRLCDGGGLLPRAYVRLTLDGIVPDARLVPGLDGLLRREATLDLFDAPQRERITPTVRWQATGLKPSDRRPIAATTASGRRRPP
jgi:hypothetical protein